MPSLKSFAEARLYAGAMGRYGLKFSSTELIFVMEKLDR
jgi:hypothetical protein